MSQNIYDKDEFFEGYTKLPRQVEGLNKAPEWPTLRSFIPIFGKGHFLDIGCGFGWVCRWASEEGASTVTGVDISTKMLERAKAFPQTTSQITYMELDLDDMGSLEPLIFKPTFYEVVFSSLTLHYVKNLKSVLELVRHSLTPGGAFVFSVEHPVFTAPRNPRFIQDADGKNVWPLDQYFTEGSRTTNWFADGVIKQHRTVASYVTMLLEAGFILEAMVEWAPTAKDLEENPAWKDEANRPSFLLIKAITPK